MCKRKGTKSVRLLIMVMFIFFVFTSPVQAVAGVKIYIEGEELGADIMPVAPFIKEGRTMVPLRAVSEGLNLSVEWDHVNRFVLISDHGTTYPLKTAPGTGGNTVRIFINGEELGAEKMDVPPVIIEGRTMVPLRAVSEGFGLEVDWNPENRYVLINKPEAAPNPPSPSRGITEPAERETKKWEQQDMVSILGNSVASAAELRAAARRMNPGAPDLAQLYISIGQEYGIRGDIAFFQAAHETGWWKYGGLVKPEQNNYCGLSATGTAAGANELLRGADPVRVWFVEGYHGAFFACEASGVEAQIQHLYAYATNAPLPSGKKLLSPRFQILEQLDRRGKAVHWEELGGWWAVPGYDRSQYASFEEAYKQGATYGQHILKLYALHTGHNF